MKSAAGHIKYVGTGLDCGICPFQFSCTVFGLPWEAMSLGPVGVTGRAGLSCDSRTQLTVFERDVRAPL